MRVVHINEMIDKSRLMASIFPLSFGAFSLFLWMDTM